MIVALPLGLAGWLALAAARGEQETIRRRFEQLMTDKLRQIDGRIAEFLSQRERQILALLRNQTPDAESYRALAREHPELSQLFRLDPQGRFIYPSPTEANREEIEFLQRAGQLIAGGELTGLQPSDEQRGRSAFQADSVGSKTRLTEQENFAPASGGRQAIAAIDEKAPENKDRGENHGAGAGHGWRAWYWEKGIHLLFYEVNSAGETRGAELEPVRLLADLIAGLPDTPPESTRGRSLPERITLVGASGEALYQWGGYEPPENSQPLVTLPVGAPLSAWRLDYFAPPDAMAGSLGKGLIASTAPGLAALAAALVGLAIYFYREHTREIREASQRVSFVNQVSHELKTPLTNIRMYAELLEQNLPENDGETRRRLDVIVSESQRLSRLISNILTFSRGSRGKLELHPTENDPDELIRVVIEHFRPALEEKGVKPEFRGGGQGSAMIDADALEQILGNLLSNVEKYAAAGGKVEMESSREGHLLRVTIADRGPGVADHLREKIFEPFVRGDSKLTEGISGAGIGLSLARELARLHGGDLVLKPRPDGGKGAWFELSLRIAPSQEMS